MELGGKDIEMNNTNNNMESIYKPGQIIYSKSNDCWVYISVLRYTKPQNASGAMQLHTCCDLSINGDDGSKTITFTRGNGTLFDVDTSFEEVREATNEEKLVLYNELVRGFKDYDLGWANHFTDSSYFDIFDWLCWEFGINIESLDPRNPSPIEDTINEIQKYIWNVLCRETGNDHACTDYVKPKMVNKQEFIGKLENWIRRNTDWTDEYIWDGRNPNYGLWDELKKYLEE